MMDVEPTENRAFFLEHGIYLDRAYIGIPHQMPPKLFSPDIDGEPDIDDGDSVVLGDNDLSSLITVKDGLTWQGHQKYVVQALAQKLMEIDDD